MVAVVVVAVAQCDNYERVPSALQFNENIASQWLRHSDGISAKPIDTQFQFVRVSHRPRRVAAINI